MGSDGLLEAFIITNKRESFPYCYKTVEDQTLSIPIHVIEGMSFVDANNKALRDCRSQFYFRIDDDFLLNKHTFKFMHSSLKGNKKRDSIIMYDCRLWEDFTSKVIRGLKVYNSILTNKLGNFKANKLGKIDKTFRDRVERSKFRTMRDRLSVVGVHSCASWGEQVKYEELWTSNASVKHTKTTRDDMKKYRKSLSYQAELVNTLLPRINKKRKSSFYKFLTRKKK